MTQPWDNLAAWFTAYDARELITEDDVENRFVTPLFRALGYSEDHLRGKVPVDLRVPGKRGRNPEADLLYYAAAEKDRQTPSTALVLVEAKHPTVQDLSEAIAQARGYGAYLKPLLLFVTNGWRIVVLRRRPVGDDERALDVMVSDLGRFEQARQLYDLLNFDAVRQQHSHLDDQLRHTQYVELERALRSYPDIQKQLKQGDFISGLAGSGRVVTVTRPKIRIKGELPLAFGKGSCEIEFSNLLRSGLTLHLNHHDLVGDCMLGLDDAPDWHTRRFIEPKQDGSFFATLGQTTMFLSAAEAADLCECLDLFCRRYRAVIIEAEYRLDTWEYPLVSTFKGLGFQILRVPVWMWELTRTFAEEFNRHNGQDPWYMFDVYPPGLCVVHRTSNLDQTCIHAQRKDITIGSEKLVDLVCVWPESMLKYATKRTGLPWQESVGKQGIWTASATRAWLIKELFPQVFKHSRQHSSRPWSHWERVFAGPAPEELIILQQGLHLTTPPDDGSAADLASYIQGIQQWLNSGILPKIAAQPLYTCMVACLSLARRADPNRVNLHYAASNTGGVEQVEQTEYDSFQYARNPVQVVFDSVIEQLTHEIEQLRSASAVEARDADLIMRSLFAILKDGNIQCGQAELNAARTEIMPLWLRARFDMRHVWPQIQR